MIHLFVLIILFYNLLHIVYFKFYICCQEFRPDLGSGFNRSSCFSKNVCIVSAVLWSGKKVSSIKYAFAFSVYYNFSEHCMTTWHSMINCKTYIALLCIKCKINKSFIIFSWKIHKPWFAHVILRNRLFVLQATLKMDAITKYSFPYLSFVNDTHG